MCNAIIESRPSAQNDSFGACLPCQCRAFATVSAIKSSLKSEGKSPMLANVFDDPMSVDSSSQPRGLKHITNVKEPTRCLLPDSNRLPPKRFHRTVWRSWARQLLTNPSKECRHPKAAEELHLHLHDIESFVA